MKTKFLPILLLFIATFASAAEIVPPKPSQFVTDQAGVLSQSTVDHLNQQLIDFDHTTSNQILVALYPKMQSDSSIDDYTLRVFNQWKPGQKKLDNGAILFVFVQDHKLFIQVGYGLEGALPDALCKRIIDEQITPRFKQNDFDGGITAGVQAMMAATKGEYKGTDPSQEETDMASRQELGQEIWIGVFVIIVICTIISRIRRYSVYGPSGLSGGWFAAPTIGSGGSFGGGGGGFSAGGGSGGGGGAGGSW
jgi:uncharacterized protein